MTTKRDRFLADIEKYKTRYQKFSTEFLRKQLPRMTIKAQRLLLRSKSYVSAVNAL